MAKSLWWEKMARLTIFRVDSLTPDGLFTWGDGRTLILGTKGFSELGNMWMWHRDQTEKSHILWVDEKGEHREICLGKSRLSVL
ncbi:MAG: hypothetical protein V8S98_02290 [Lachnospiraceae bacterium]